MVADFFDKPLQGSLFQSSSWGLLSCATNEYYSSTTRTTTTGSNTTFSTHVKTVGNHREKSNSEVIYNSDD